MWPRGIVTKNGQGVGVALGGIILDTAMRKKSSRWALARGAYGVGAVEQSFRLVALRKRRMIWV